MEKHLRMWLDVITKMANDNTYKLAWGRGIIECAISNNFIETDDDIEISFFQIGEKVLKYYWNQIFFFNLKQGPNLKKPPIIYQITEEIIEKYKSLTKTNIPVWYDQACRILFEDEKYYESVVNRVATALKQDVCWRFLKINGKIVDIYELNKKEKWIRFRKEDSLIIKDYGILLIQLLNYKWAQLLEQFNRVPRITSKVKGSQELKIKRNNLSRYKDILLKEFDKGKIHDFYTGEALNKRDISVDHVLPWSFMYSDDIWNLVITSKRFNSSKSNSIPSKEYIEKLKQRNKNLVYVEMTGKDKSELMYALNNDIISKYYLDLQG